MVCQYLLIIVSPVNTVQSTSTHFHICGLWL